MLLARVLDQHRHRRDAFDLVQRHRVERRAVGVGEALVHLGRHQSVRTGDLPVLAVESNLHLIVSDDVAPLTALAQVDVADQPLRRVEAPPALDELWRRPRLEDQIGRCVEDTGDEDLGV